MENMSNSVLSGSKAIASAANTHEQPAGPSGSPPSPPRHSVRVGWRIAQVANLAVTVALLVALVLRPETALRVMWTVLIPVLPASFLISPLLWRGICPLATLNRWSSGLLGRRQLAGRLLAGANALGIVLLVLLVPARRLLFNEYGPALAATIVLVALAAVILGARFDRRAGFCNAVCPILPVERLYGQHPLLTLASPHCDRCTLCVPKGCLDLDATKSFAQAIGRTGGRHAWLSRGYGIFAAAMPGFIVGYYTLSNVPWTEAPGVYLWMALWSGGSYLATTVLVRLFNLTSPVSCALLAALSVGLYYWWAAPLIVETLHLPATAGLVLRGTMLALVAFWLVRARPDLQSHRISVQPD